MAIAALHSAATGLQDGRGSTAVYVQSKSAFRRRERGRLLQKSRENGSGAFRCDSDRQTAGKNNRLCLKTLLKFRPSQIPHPAK